MPPPSPSHGLSASPKPPLKNPKSPSDEPPFLLPPAMPIDLADDLQSLSFGSQTVSSVSTTSGSSSSSSSTCDSLNPSPISSGADPCLESIRRIANPDGSIAISDLRFIQRLGSGDIGSVYLAEVRGNAAGGVVVAAKVMDKKELIGRNKSARAKTEKEILEMLDHPFLPKLYGCAENDRVTSLLTEFCPGGDLHVLRQRQPGKRFDEHAVRFYAAEVVVALEYIHMLGIIYRDLKPENVLVRSDGHIMLTDFDLSLKADFGCSPAAQLIPSHQSTLPSSSIPHPKHRAAATASTTTHCILPNCIVPAVSCFHPNRNRPKKPNRRGAPAAGLVFVAEPIDLRSMSFVGTHEYLAPEIVSGEGHGSSVDWWTLGILIFELLHGATPFKGSDNELTLANIVARALEFPKETMASAPARDLIAGLLVKDPASRLGSTLGATAVKRHPFFSGVNWALLRCAVPPHVPPPFCRDLSDDSGPGTPVEYF